MTNGLKVKISRWRLTAILF